MTKTKVNSVIAYHDETKIKKHQLKGHIFFFVPTRLNINYEGGLFSSERIMQHPLRSLFKRVEEIRFQHGCDRKFHFNEISGKRWHKQDNADRELMELLADALRSKGAVLFDYPLNCKFAVIYYFSSQDVLGYGGHQKWEKRLRHDETVMRVLLKGAVHYLYEGSDRIQLEQIVTDGQPASRRLDEDRIIWRLLEQDHTLREHVTIAPEAQIIHLPKSNHREFVKGSIEYIHANMLQCCDMILGSVNQCCIFGLRERNRRPVAGQSVTCKKSIITRPIAEVLQKWKRGRGFRNSGHYRSFAISEARIEDGEWFFQRKGITEASTYNSELELFKLC